MVDKIRVLHLMAKWGRSHDLINEYIKSLDPDRFESILCSMDGGPKDGFKPEGYLLHPLGYSSESLHGFHPRIAWNLKRLLVEQDIRILHCHKHKSILYGVMAAVLSGKKDLRVVATVHSLRRSRTLNRRLTNFFLFPRISRIIGVSEAVRQDVLRANRFLKPEKIMVIHNGINLDRFPLRTGTGQRETWPVLGTVGRLVHTKGQIYLLRAFAEVMKTYPDALLLFAGDGPLLEDLEQEAEKLGIVDRVRFLGFQEDVQGFLRGLDLFMFPSLAEGLALSVLESMATGIPVIASSVGGIPEILEGQPCGRLIEPRDVKGLARSTVELLSKGEQGLVEMGRQGRKRVEEAFSLQRMVGDTERLYLQVTGSR
jgi:glycosyltransferase involved in cell wall biosynthesis